MKDIRKGGFYVNKTESSVREVIEIKDDDMVVYHDFAQFSGKRYGESKCNRSSFARWAERVATSEEIARLDRDVLPSELDSEKIHDAYKFLLDTPTNILGYLPFIRKDATREILKNTPSELLVEELNSRGIKFTG